MKSRFDIKKVLTRSNVFKFIRVNIGTIILAIGIHFFFTPSHLIVGGATGLSIILGFTIGVSVPLILFILNLFLMAIGIMTLGMIFGALTLYSSFMLSVFLGVLEHIAPMTTPFTDDLFINIVFGVLINAVGIAMIINAGASSGGTDIVGKIVEKYTRFSFGNGIMAVDGLITLAALVFFGVERGMYSLLGVIFNSIVIDKLIAGFNSKYNVNIITSEIEDINKFIIVELHRGSTIYEAKGGFSNDERKILSTVLDRTQYIRLRQFIKKKDKYAFMFIAPVHEITGEGFTFTYEERLKMQDMEKQSK